MQTTEVVVFDLGKVLLDFDYAVAVRNLSRHCSATESELLAMINQSALLHRYETGLITTTEFFEEVKKSTQFCREFDFFEPLFADIFSPINSMIDLNERIRKRGLKTFIFSNTNEIAVRHIRNAYPFFRHFDAYILSYEHRAMKPHPDIYKVVEKEAGTATTGILYIDDRLENVEQGASRGWQTIHHLSAEATISHVERLLELPKLRV